MNVIEQSSDAYPLVSDDNTAPKWIPKFVAAAGERNQVEVTGMASDRYASRASHTATVKDSTAPLSVGVGCKAVDTHTASCHYTGSVWVETGDQADSIKLGGVVLGAKLDAGPGDDLVNDTAIADFTQISGGGGRDQIHAGGGDDLILDGDTDASADADVLDGGAGWDAVSYRARHTSVTLDLSQQTPAGAVGEGDQIAGFEEAVGGRGNDTLIGSRKGFGRYDLPFLGGGAGNDHLVALVASDVDGGPGNDVIDGSPKSDEIEAGPGNDRVNGGAGVDRVTGEAGEDLVHGGSDNDLLLGGDGRDRLFGGTGSDEINGGFGRDQLFGGAGYDDFFTRDGDRDQVRCGTSRGHVKDRVRADKQDSTARDCEHVFVRAPRREPLISAGRQSATWR